MAKYKRRAFIKLDARIKRWEENCRLADARSPGSSRGLRRPGSMKSKKQA